MINHADEIHALECQVRSLDRLLAEANRSLIDDYAKAALGGLLAYGYSPRELVVEESFRIARLCLEERKKCQPPCPPTTPAAWPTPPGKTNGARAATPAPGISPSATTNSTAACTSRNGCAFQASSSSLLRLRTTRRKRTSE